MRKGKQNEDKETEWEQGNRMRTGKQNEDKETEWGHGNRMRRTWRTWRTWNIIRRIG